jgi:hypothetical protein
MAPNECPPPQAPRGDFFIPLRFPACGIRRRGVTKVLLDVGRLEGM